mmetsp:Transcript_9706/g.44063  ORF Transcript_9706/g.44063 Transcript_9706/m.44063 type:complete len:267 (-) Transcript_9706:1065-1865(-)
MRRTCCARLGTRRRSVTPYTSSQPPRWSRTSARAPRWRLRTSARCTPCSWTCSEARSSWWSTRSSSCSTRCPTTTTRWRIEKGVHFITDYNIHRVSMRYVCTLQTPPTALIHSEVRDTNSGTPISNGLSPPSGTMTPACCISRSARFAFSAIPTPTAPPITLSSLSTSSWNHLSAATTFNSSEHACDVAGIIAPTLPTLYSHSKPVYSSQLSTSPYTSVSLLHSDVSPPVISSKDSQAASPSCARNSLSVHTPLARARFTAATSSA